MKIRTFLAQLRVRNGEHETEVSILLVANSIESAATLHDFEASQFYGASQSQKLDGGYYSNHDTVHVSTGACTEIGMATFLELSRILSVHRAPNVPLPKLEDLTSSVQAAAKPLHSALSAKAAELTQSDVLHALASSWGEKNWHVLKAKIDGPAKEPLKALIAAARSVVLNADDSGCTEDLTVTSKEAVEALDEALDALDEAQDAAVEASLAANCPMRENVVLDLVEDVKRRARANDFNFSGLVRAQRLAANSAEVLNLDATPQEIAEAARRLA